MRQVSSRTISFLTPGWPTRTGMTGTARCSSGPTLMHVDGWRPRSITRAASASTSSMPHAGASSVIELESKPGLHEDARASANTTPRRSPRSRRWCTRASRPSVARSTGRALLAGEAPQDRPTRCGVRGRASTRTVGAHGPVEVVIEHVNGVDAPVHLRLLVRLHQGDVPPGYRPMTGPRRETFAE